MIPRNDRAKVARDQVSNFLDLSEPLPVHSRVEDPALDSSGWLEKRAHVRGGDSGCGNRLLGLFFGFVFLAGCGFSVVCVQACLLEWRADNRYLPNSCVVLDKRLAEGLSDVVVVSGETEWTEQRPSYRPEIKIRYEVGGRDYSVWTYDVTARLYTDRVAQQAIVDSFQVGGTYPCWYDPDRPEKATLVRGHPWSSRLAFIVPIAFLGFGGAGIRHVWKHRAKKAQQPDVSRAMPETSAGKSFVKAM
jgi:hypothetical protein